MHRYFLAVFPPGTVIFLYDTVFFLPFTYFLPLPALLASLLAALFFPTGSLAFHSDTGSITTDTHAGYCTVLMSLISFEGFLHVVLSELLSCGIFSLEFLL